MTRWCCPGCGNSFHYPSGTVRWRCWCTPQGILMLGDDPIYDCGDFRLRIVGTLPV